MGLLKWLRKENRTEPVTLATLLASLDGPGSTSGKKVSETTALEYVPFYTGVRILAESVASLPLIVYERIEGGKERALTHPAYSLLHDSPNSEMTAAVFKEVLQGHVVTWGNGYAHIMRDGAGRPVELWPLLPDRTTPIRKNGIKFYEVRDGSGKEIGKLPAENVLHIPGLGFDGIVGYSVIAMVRNAVGMGMSSDEFGSKFFANATQLGGILKHPQTLSPEAHKRLTDSWNAKYGGAGNAWKPAILEEGMDWMSVGIPPRDAQFLELRKFQATEIARFFRIPPHMMADLDRATFSNIEHLSLEFVKYTLKIWLTKWEQECTRKLFSPKTRGKYFCEFLYEEFLRGDFKTRVEGYASAIQNGWLTRNEVRAKENLNPLPGLDEPLVPLNMGDGSQAEGDEGQMASAHEKMLEDVIGRLLAKEADRAQRAGKKLAGEGEFDKWVDEYFVAERERMIEGLMVPAAVVAASHGLGDPRQVVEAHVDEYITASKAELAEAYRMNTFAKFPHDDRRATEARYLYQQLLAKGK